MGRTVAVVVVVTAAILALSRVAIALAGTGDFRLMNAVVLTLLGCMFVGPIVSVIQNARRPKSDDQLPPCPFPRAIPANVLLGNGRGASVGWLYAEAGFLRFRGERFDFALRAGDFEPRKQLLRDLRAHIPLRLRTPAGITPATVTITPVALRRGRWHVDREAWKRLEVDLEWWAQGSGQGGTLYPPLRSGLPAATLTSILFKAVPTCIVAGLAVGFLPQIVGIPLPDRNMGLAGCLAALWAFGLWMTIALGIRNNPKYDREIERLRTKR
jgi:hypothetical protein